MKDVAPGRARAEQPRPSTQPEIVPGRPGTEVPQQPDPGPVTPAPETPRPGPGPEMPVPRPSGPEMPQPEPAHPEMPKPQTPRPEMPPRPPDRPEIPQKPPPRPEIPQPEQPGPGGPPPRPNEMPAQPDPAPSGPTPEVPPLRAHFARAGTAWAALTVTLALGCEAPDTQADLLIVLNKAEDTAALVDPGALKVIAKLPTGESPHEVATTPDGRFAFVANYGTGEAPGHTLTMLDLRTREVARTIELGTYTRPHGIEVSRDGRRVWVTCEGARAVIELDAAAALVSQDWTTGQLTSHMLVAARDESKLYVANVGSGTCTVIDRNTNRLRTIRTGPGAEGIDRSPLDGTVWIADREVDSLSVIDPGADTVLTTFKAAGKMPIRVQFTPDGREVWVSNSGSASISVYDARSRALVATIAVGDTPVGIQMMPNGRRAFVASSTADKISVVDVKSRKVVRTFSTGKSPDGMAWAVR